MAVHAVCTGRDVGRQITQAMREIRRAHAIGTRIVALVDGAEGGSRTSIPAAAAAEGVAVDTAYRDRELAGLERGYTAEDLDRYEDLCVAHGRVPQITLLRKLLQVPRGEQREQLLVQAVAEGWSKFEQDAEFRSRRPRQRAPGGGRPPKVADDAAGLLRQIEDHCTRWTRWATAARDKFPAAVRTRIDAVDEAMRRLLASEPAGSAP